MRHPDASGGILVVSGGILKDLEAGEIRHRGRLSNWRDQNEADIDARLWRAPTGRGQNEADIDARLWRAPTGGGSAMDQPSPLGRGQNEADMEGRDAGKQ